MREEKARGGQEEPEGARKMGTVFWRPSRSAAEGVRMGRCDLGHLPLLPPILTSKPDSKETLKPPFQSSLRSLRK